MANASGGKARTRRQGASRRPAEAADRGRPLRWFTAGAASGILLSFLTYLALLPAETPPGEEAPATAGEPGPATEPRYEFFEVLPQQSIEVDVDPAEVEASRGGAGGGDVYLLQAGSFRQADDADRRRAELLLLGLEPRVEETSGANGRWYRVLLGPFPSRSRMAAARSLTAQQNIDTLLLKRSAGGP